MIGVRTTPEADGQARDADTWWRANRPAATDLFLSELFAAFGLLADAPAIGRPYRRRGIPALRRLLLRESRYHLYYIHDTRSDEIVVLAIWSAIRGRGPRLRLPSTE